MEYTKRIIITNNKGIHTRIVAMLVYKAIQTNNNYKVTLFIQREGSSSKIPMASMIALTSLGITRRTVVLKARKYGLVK